MRRLEDVIGISLTSVPEKPPNWDAIIKVFPHVALKTGVLFCHGDKIYNPSKVHIPTHLLAHECVHSLQQKDGITVEEWWDAYLKSPEFRFDQETEAHCVELEEYNLNFNRVDRRQYIHRVADRLSGPLYGNLTTHRKAVRLLKGATNVSDH